MDVDITFSNPGASFDRFEFDLLYDPSVLRFIQFSRGSAIASWTSFDAQEVISGLLRGVGFDLGSGVTAGESGVLVTANFEVVGCADGETTAMALDLSRSPFGNTFDGVDGTFTCLDALTPTPSPTPTLTPSPTPTCVAPTGTLTFTPGWNLIGYSQVPQGARTMSDLVASLDAQGIDVVVIAFWRDNGWRVFIPGLGFNNALLEANTGLFVSTENSGSWSYLADCP